MIDQILSGASLLPSSKESLAKLDSVQDWLATIKQTDIVTEHVFHAGMYARTIRVDSGMVLTGTLIKIPTLLIIRGEFDMLVGEHWVSLSGYQVLCGPAGRKQAFVTRSDVEMTMIFPTIASDVYAAEAEFTDETEKLMSRRGGDDTVRQGD